MAGNSFFDWFLGGGDSPAVPQTPNTIPAAPPPPMTQPADTQGLTPKEQAYRSMPDSRIRALAPYLPEADAEARRRGMKGVIGEAADWLTQTTRQNIPKMSDDQIRTLADRGNPLAIREAMSRGMPGYASDTTAAQRDAMRHGSAGMAVPADVGSPAPGALPPPPQNVPRAVPRPVPGDFAGAMQKVVSNPPVAMPRPNPSMPAMQAGPQGAMASPVPEPSTGLFGMDPKRAQMFRDFGLALMAAGEPTPGAVVGPSLAGAIGRAGLGTIQQHRKLDAASAAAEFERQKHADEMAVEERKIKSTEALRKATIEAKAEADQLRNEISAGRLKNDRATLDVRISGQEQKAIDDLGKNNAYLMAEPPDQQRMVDNVHRMYDRIRQENGFSPQHTGTPQANAPTATNPKTGEKLILQNGQWVPMK